MYQCMIPNCATEEKRHEDDRARGSVDGEEADETDF